MNILRRANIDEASLLRVYTLAGDRSGKKNLAEAIVEAARHEGLSGATVLRGITGFGRHGYDPLLLIEQLALQRQPLIVEIIDSPDKLKSFLPILFALNQAKRLVTLEPIRIHSYHAGNLA